MFDSLDIEGYILMTQAFNTQALKLFNTGFDKNYFSMQRLLSG